VTLRDLAENQRTPLSKVHWWIWRGFLYELLNGLNRDALEQRLQDKEMLLWQRDMRTQRHVLISEDLRAERWPFLFLSINNVRKKYVFVTRVVVIKLHCSATVQRCIHNPSVLSEQIQLWPRGIHKPSAPHWSRRWSSSMKSGSRAIRGEFCVPRKVTYDPREMTQRIDYAQSSSTDRNRKPSLTNSTFHWVNPWLIANNSCSQNHSTLTLFLILLSQTFKYL